MTVKSLACVENYNEAEIRCEAFFDAWELV